MPRLYSFMTTLSRCDISIRVYGSLVLKYPLILRLLEGKQTNKQKREVIHIQRQFFSSLLAPTQC